MYGGKSSNLEIEDTLRIKSILIPLLIISIATLSGIIYSNTAEAVQVERYWSVLEAYDHSSPNTDAEGFIGVKFREDFKQLVYNVNVNNIDNITGIYLYSRGNDNEEPRIILDLLKEAKEVRVKDIFKETSTLLGKKHEIEGTVSVGGVTSDDLRGDLKGKSLKDLHKLMLHGGTFIKILTKEFPRGEIGGSDFVPIDRFFPDMSDFRWKS
ncbi:MAG: CHRD domain-containing protein [Nitrososphaeraceae archaeon]|nr:CHRD domain-containing protein [Nitrososphaeraceae archaeon]MDW0192566.1 CHRD domain-containing protein [Nitrososphaeraceae archaeon]MDW0199374.1 CHRD domain-containing protein [Nitrososphaeraceae archaeon]MDW0236764.1 CHRD domain-containing protein [Nitrososphaeraceae archaeon]MDW0308318.1 CHRD domain-containing protein [Nitrososphaeraceae archaeon]